MAKIYLATSWRNTFYTDLLQKLRDQGHEVYDFRDPEGAFKWEQVTGQRDGEWSMNSIPTFIKYINHSECVRGFNRDKDAIDACDTLVLLLPCGNSGHLEAGYAVGQGKRVIWYLNYNKNGLFEPELMYRFAPEFVTTDDQLFKALNKPTPTRAGNVAFTDANNNTVRIGDTVEYSGGGLAQVTDIVQDGEVTIRRLYQSNLLTVKWGSVCLAPAQPR